MILFYPIKKLLVFACRHALVLVVLLLAAWWLCVNRVSELENHGENRRFVLLGRVTAVEDGNGYDSAYELHDVSGSVWVVAEGRPPVVGGIVMLVGRIRSTAGGRPVIEESGRIGLP